MSILKSPNSAITDTQVAMIAVARMNFTLVILACFKPREMQMK